MIRKRPYCTVAQISNLAGRNHFPRGSETEFKMSEKSIIQNMYTQKHHHVLKVVLRNSRSSAQHHVGVVYVRFTLYFLALGRNVTIFLPQSN